MALERPGRGMPLLSSEPLLFLSLIFFLFIAFLSALPPLGSISSQCESGLVKCISKAQMKSLSGVAAALSELSQAHLCKQICNICVLNRASLLQESVAACDISRKLPERIDGAYSQGIGCRRSTEEEAKQSPGKLNLTLIYFLSPRLQDLARSSKAAGEQRDCKRVY